MRALVPLLALALTSCATELIGPYAHSLSPDDLRQIHRLVAQHPDIAQSIQYIHVTRPGCVFVETGHSLFEGVRTTFSACKRNGIWQINEHSMEQWRVVVTS